MAYVAAKDITAVTWNSKAHLAWVDSIDGLNIEPIFMDRTPMGAAWPVPLHTGYWQHDDIIIAYLYDSASTPTPNADITPAQSATLLITLATNQSITGTFVVGPMNLKVAAPGINLLTVTYKPSGAIVWDLLAAA
jgi:hypothetical protein